jgi:hypothetical protein
LVLNRWSTSGEIPIEHNLEGIGRYRYTVCKYCKQLTSIRDTAMKMQIYKKGTRRPSHQTDCDNIHTRPKPAPKLTGSSIYDAWSQMAHLRADHPVTEFHQRRDREILKTIIDNSD